MTISKLVIVLLLWTTAGSVVVVARELINDKNITMFCEAYLEPQQDNN